MKYVTIMAMLLLPILSLFAQYHSQAKACVTNEGITLRWAPTFDDDIWARNNPWGEKGLLQKIKDQEGEIRLIYSKPDDKLGIRYYEFDYVLEDWRNTDILNIGQLPLSLDLIATLSKHYGHESLDIIGLVPVIGEAADLTNATWYLCEGELGDAALSAASMLPIIGDYTAKSTKYTIKVVKADKLLKSIDVSAESLNRFRLAIKDCKGEFFEDFADASDDVLIRFVEKPELVDSWRIIRHKHPIDCKNIKLLDKIDELRKLENTSKEGFTDEVIPNIKGVFFGPNISTVDLEDVINTCLDFSRTVSDKHLTLVNFDKVIGELSKGQSFTAGAEWTVRYIGQHGDEFAGKSLSFEVVEDINETLRRVDLVVPDEELGFVYYEFKSVKDVPPSHFLEQFSKDLANSKVTDLSQIRWIFDGKKVPADFKSKMMEEIKKIEVRDDVCKKFKMKDLGGLINEIGNEFDNIFLIGK